MVPAEAVIRVVPAEVADSPAEAVIPAAQVAAADSQAEPAEVADSPEAELPVVAEAEELSADKKKRARWRSFFIASLPRET